MRNGTRAWTPARERAISPMVAATVAADAAAIHSYRFHSPTSSIHSQKNTIHATAHATT
jgi:hypothetical protein